MPNLLVSPSSIWDEMTILILVTTDFANKDLYSRDALDPSKDTPGPAASVGGSQDTSVHKTAPNPINPGNILLREFPPPVLEDGQSRSTLLRVTTDICGAQDWPTFTPSFLVTLLRLSPLSR